ncbi:MAG: CHAD domain-containing protein [Gammaproteobacteria bacterium]
MRSEFIIPNGLDIRELQARLQHGMRLEAEPPAVERRTSFDSFDWRVHGNAAILEGINDGKKHRLVWRPLSADKQREQAILAKAPRFARELPPGRLHDRLEAIVEMRELLPLVTITSRLHTLRVLNKLDKTVARVAFQENSARRPGGARSFKLDRRAVVIPVRGYQKPCKQLVKALKDLGLTLAGGDLMLTALARVGLTPGGYTPRLNLELESGMRADQAARRILLRLLDILEANEAGARAGTDTEFLHDFRVAVRRTRSALTQIKGVLPLRTVNHYKTEFAWLGQVTTPVRDLDVYLLNFDSYRASLPASARADIEPLRDFLIRHRRIEYQAMVKSLDSSRYRRLVNNWREFLRRPVPNRSSLSSATRPVLEVACERIWHIYQRALKQGRAIGADSPEEALHELRKTCKKLRYLMEFFQSLFPPRRIKSPIRALKALQDNLGEYQDCTVQIETLKRFSHQMVAEGDIPPDTLLAMGMLIDELERRQQAAHEEFAERFGKFNSSANHAHYRELFTGCSPVAGEASA